MDNIWNYIAFVHTLRTSAITNEITLQMYSLLQLHCKYTVYPLVHTIVVLCTNFPSSTNPISLHTFYSLQLPALRHALTLTYTRFTMVHWIRFTSYLYPVYHGTLNAASWYTLLLTLFSSPLHFQPAHRNLPTQIQLMKDIPFVYLFLWFTTYLYYVYHGTLNTSTWYTPFVIPFFNPPPFSTPTLQFTYSDSVN